MALVNRLNVVFVDAWVPTVGDAPLHAREVARGQQRAAHRALSAGGHVKPRHGLRVQLAGTFGERLGAAPEHPRIEHRPRIPAIGLAHRTKLGFEVPAFPHRLLHHLLQPMGRKSPGLQHLGQKLLNC
jgi:hypothetical protein